MFAKNVLIGKDSIKRFVEMNLCRLCHKLALAYVQEPANVKVQLDQLAALGFHRADCQQALR